MENTMNFSATTLGFYPSAYKDSYEAQGAWPEDAVEISDEEYATYRSAAPQGKILGATEDGQPAWVGKAVSTQEELVEAAETQKNTLLYTVNQTTQMWQTQLALGIITDADKTKLTTWMVYAQTVDAIDTSKAPDITWPEMPST